MTTFSTLPWDVLALGRQSLLLLKFLQTGKLFDWIEFIFAKYLMMLIKYSLAAAKLKILNFYS